MPTPETLAQTPAVQNTSIPIWVAFATVIIVQVSMYVLEWRKSLHEKAKEEDARKFALKRELYLNFIAAFVDGVDLMRRIPNAIPSEMASLSPSLRSLEAFAAKDLIATREVILQTRKSAKVFAEAVLNLLAVKNEEIKLAIDIEGIGIRLKPLLLHQEKIIDALRALTPGVDDARSQFISEQGAYINETIQPLIAEQSLKVRMQGALRQRLSELHAGVMPEITASLAQVTVALRKDLNLATDDEVIAAILTRVDPEIGFKVSEFLAETWRTFGINPDVDPPGH